MFIYDFDKLDISRKVYDGCEPKTCLSDGRHFYVLKEPRPMKGNIPSSRKDQQAEYYYNCISEYLGSEIFNLCGIETQKTYLGNFTCHDGVKRLCVACEDFTTDEKYLDLDTGKTSVLLISMAMYKHDFKRQGTNDDTLVGREDGDAYLDELDYIWLNSKYLKDKYEKIKKEYYNRFVVDALIGNPDRHNGNRGFLVPASGDEKIKEIFKISPVYDCGASFLSQANSNRLVEVLNSKELLQTRFNDFPKTQVSPRLQNGLTGIKFGSYFNSLENEELNKAIIEMTPKIKEVLPDIYDLIDDMVYSEVISKSRGNFYKTFIEGRFNNIILSSYLKLEKVSDCSIDKEKDDEMER